MVEVSLRVEAPRLRAVSVVWRLVRTVHREGKRPEIVTFHEPHGSNTIRLGTLTEYLRKLEITREEFLAHLAEC